MRYNKICLMVPTYKRTQRLKVLIDSALDTADKKDNVVFSFCVNKKDKDTRTFINEYNAISASSEIIDESTMQPNLSFYYNEMYEKTQFKEAIVTEIGDDMIFKTVGWDKRILDVINASDGNAIVHCDDEYIAGEKCCVNLFVTRELVDRTKKPFMCSYFHADMIDVVWTLAGYMTGLKTYLGDVKIFHNHASRSGEDETFRRLKPIQAEVRNNNAYAVAYATIVARNIIESGVGKWNILQ